MGKPRDKKAPAPVKGVYELGFGDGFERGYVQGMERAAQADEKPAHRIPPVHLRAGDDPETMTRPELVELLWVKCQTIDQQSSRHRNMIEQIEKILDRTFHVAVPLESALQHLIDHYEKRAS